MKSFFESCADLGDSIIRFVQKDKINAIVVGLLFVVSPVNIIMWILMLCAVYRRRQIKRGKK